MFYPAYVRFPQAEGAGGLPAKVFFLLGYFCPSLKVGDPLLFAVEDPAQLKMASALLAAKILFCRAGRGTKV